VRVDRPDTGAGEHKGSPHGSPKNGSAMLRTTKNRRVSVMAVRPPVFRAVKPDPRFLRGRRDDSPIAAEVKCLPK
jgi:hypothetical protein